MKNHGVPLAWTAAVVGMAVSVCVTAETKADDAKRRPNIIVIVADDLGYADVGFNGCKDVPTPNIDSLAKQGVRFTDGHVSCPVCSPTRAGLMTGRYQQRFGHELNPGPPRQADTNFGLPLSEQTLPQLLKAAGYHTGMVGKWHLGFQPEFHPQKRGFDSFFGFPGGAHSYIDAKADPANLIYRGTEPVEEKEYLTDAFGREAVKFLDEQKGEPYFLYLPFNAVHSPLQAPNKYLERFPNITDNKRRTFAAMLSAMDDSIGKVLEKVRERKEVENTLIFFVSDNGGPTPGNTSRNNPFRGYKAQVWEGGTREPFAVAWPKVLPAGKVYDQPIISLDILPTCLAAAGAKGPEKPLDGVDLVPFLTGRKSGAPHETLYWRYGNQSAIRMGDWKLVQIAKQPPQLFNLKDDLSEAHDLANEKPEKLHELQVAYEKWNAQLIDPLWAGRRAMSPDGQPGNARQERQRARRNRT